MAEQKHNNAMTGENVPLSTLFKLICKHGQRLLVYPAGFPLSYPDNIYYPSDFGIPYMAPLIRTSDGVDLTCFLLPQTEDSLVRSPPTDRQIRRGQVPRVQDVKVELTPAAADARATVVVFHGNGEHHWEDMLTAGYLFWLKCNVLLVSYRGYSLSTGRPSEGGLRKDAQAALDWLLAQPYVSQAPIIIHGHSLGGAVAVDVASRNPDKISALMLSCTFTSIPDIVRTWPYLRHFSFCCTQRWNSAAKLRKIPKSIPILMSSGRKDEVVPPELMDRLWEIAKSRGEDDVRSSRKGKARVGRWLWKAKEKVEDTVELVSRRRRGSKESIRTGRSEDVEKGKLENEEVEDSKPANGNFTERTPWGDMWQAYERGTHCQTPSTTAYRMTMKNFIESVVGPTPFIKDNEDPLERFIYDSAYGSGPSSPSSRRSLTLPPDAGRKRIEDVRWHWKDGKLYKRELGESDLDVCPVEWFEYPSRSEVVLLGPAK